MVFTKIKTIRKCIFMKWRKKLQKTPESSRDRRPDEWRTHFFFSTFTLVQTASSHQLFVGFTLMLFVIFYSIIWAQSKIFITVKRLSVCFLLHGNKLETWQRLFICLLQNKSLEVCCEETEVVNHSRINKFISVVEVTVLCGDGGWSQKSNSFLQSSDPRHTCAPSISSEPLSSANLNEIWGSSCVSQTLWPRIASHTRSQTRPHVWAHTSRCQNIQRAYQIKTTIFGAKLRWLLKYNFS